MRRLLFNVLFISLTLPCSGQSVKDEVVGDSVSVILKSSVSVRDKISNLHGLGKHLDPENSDEAELALTKALQLALELRDPEHIAESYHLLADLYRHHSSYFKAIASYKNALKYETKDVSLVYLQLGICYLRITQLDSAKATLLKGLELNPPDSKHTEASLNNALGNVLKDQDDYKQALEYYLKSTSIFESIGDKAGLTQSISNVGNVQYLLKNYDLAMDYANQSLQYAQESGVQSSVAYSNRLMGRIYRKQGKLEDALQSYERAIAIYKKLGARRDISETHYNTGNIYYEKSDFASAIREYRSALTIQRAISDYYNMAYSYSAIGQAYFELKKFDNSLMYLDSAQKISSEHKFPYVVLDVLDYKSMIHARENRFRDAYELHLAYSALKDSLSQEENRQAAREVEAKYAASKKEEQIKSLQAESDLVALRLQKERTQRNYLAAFVVLSLALVGVLYNRYKLKNKTAQKLQELDQVKSRFFTYLSHEFRTPLTLISGPLEQRLQRTEDPEEKAELQLMLKNSRRLGELINQLMDLAKIESGHMQLHLSSGDIQQVLRLIAASFLSLAEHKGISFQVKINAEAEDPVFDRDKIEKVIYNLLSNAFKFTPAGGEVSFTAHVIDSNLEVTVADTGPGIPPEKIPFVFDRFYQIEEPTNRNAEGSGIGLALSKELAHLHRGMLKVKSDSSNGSEFVFTIPLGRDAYPTHTIVNMPDTRERILPAFNEIAASPVMQNDESEQKPVILIAEDSADMRGFLRGILASRYSVVEAPNGEEAFLTATQIVPDLIVTDVMMPKMDGITFCEKIKTTSSTNHIPVVMLTARADTDSRLEGLATGADDYLSKPFDGRELMMRIHNLIQQRKLLQDVFRERVIWEPKQLNLKEPDELFMEKFIGILEANYSNAQFGVDQVCQEIALSRMQLHRKLKSITGKSPGDFLRSFRVERAKQMLASGSPVSQAAFNAGFNNLSNFSKVFKEHTGTLPSDFAQTQRQPT